MKQDTVLAIAGILGVVAAATLALGVIVLKFWLIGSLLTSSVKSISGSCSETYPIESFVSGNWFCPSQENN